jgi:signal transduction histidine kinase
LLVEYQILRRVLVEELTDELARPLTQFEILAVNSGIDTAMRLSAVEYAEHQANKITADAEAMSKFLSYLSHDLRGGLNGSILLVEVLKRDLAKDEKYKTSIDDLDNIRQSMLQTVATMERFLHAERLRRGRMPVKRATFDLADLIHGCIRDVRYQYGASAPPITAQIPAGISLESDRELLTIVLHNLLSNAIKYGYD